MERRAESKNIGPAVAASNLAIVVVIATVRVFSTSSWTSSNNLLSGPIPKLFAYSSSPLCNSHRISCLLLNPFKMLSPASNIVRFPFLPLYPWIVGINDSSSSLRGYDCLGSVNRKVVIYNVSINNTFDIAPIANYIVHDLELMSSYQIEIEIEGWLNSMSLQIPTMMFSRRTLRFLT